jgi:hypothetical protein
LLARGRTDTNDTKAPSARSQALAIKEVMVLAADTMRWQSNRLSVEARLAVMLKGQPAARSDRLLRSDEG